MGFFCDHNATLNSYLQFLATLSEQLDQAFLMPDQNNIHHVLSLGKYHIDIADHCWERLYLYYLAYSPHLSKKKKLQPRRFGLFYQLVDKILKDQLLHLPKNSVDDGEVTHLFEANKCTIVIVY
ncbi:hypothetical protein AVEN_84756-1 [Araneus ventricosus]|uniref:Uncharacterized protein n=1 Tax=Araneus ventricosus TaxID=182803 RepID=A0A4Y2SLM5_ARAVE|nr:hypothetical protein AVEN_84756-1 [Araneus ventricosus]